MVSRIQSTLSRTCTSIVLRSVMNPGPHAPYVQSSSCIIIIGLQSILPLYNYAKVKTQDQLKQNTRE